MSKKITLAKTALVGSTVYKAGKSLEVDDDVAAQLKKLGLVADAKADKADK